MTDFGQEAATALGVHPGQVFKTLLVDDGTGYVVGGISPFGQRRSLRTVVDASALAHETVLVSGGRRGLDLELAPTDLVAVTAASTADIIRT